MNATLLALILADIGDVIGSIVGILFLVIWVIGQLAGGKKQQKPPRGRPVEPVRLEPVQKPGEQPPAQRAAAGGGDPLRDQVEEFLRRAGRQQKPNQARPAQRPPAAPGRQRPAAARDKIEVLVPEEPSAKQRDPLSQPFQSQKKREAPPARRAPAGAPEKRGAQRTGRPKHESVAEHVADHVAASTRSLAEHTSHLGESVVMADEQFDVQLHTKFDHQLGSLSQRHDDRMTEQQEAPKPKTPAQQIAAMLTNPEGVRQAIVLNEILRRPDDRW